MWNFVEGLWPVAGRTAHRLALDPESAHGDAMGPAPLQNIASGASSEYCLSDPMPNLLPESRSYSAALIAGGALLALYHSAALLALYELL
jgi:hypothetical protein